MFDPNRDYGPDPEESPFTGTGDIKPEVLQKQAEQQQKDWEEQQYPDDQPDTEPDNAA